MNAAEALKSARRRARMTQRELAEQAGVPQSTVARIENGTIDPKASTLDGLLRRCGDELSPNPRLGEGIDRTLIAQLLKLSLTERFDHGVTASRNLSHLKASIRWKNQNSTRSSRLKS